MCYPDYAAIPAPLNTAKFIHWLFFAYFPAFLGGLFISYLAVKMCFLGKINLEEPAAIAAATKAAPVVWITPG